MLTLRTLAIMITGAWMFAGLPLTDAQACDDDRYPCPVRSQTLTQETADAPAETADAPARLAPSAQPRKKVSHPARPSEKAQAKGEREAPRAPAPAKVNKPAVQEQVADSISQKAADPAPAVVPLSRADQPLNDESRDETPEATAATALPAFPNTEGAGAPGATAVDATEAALPNTESAGASAPGATAVDATEAVRANAVQLVDPNEVNDAASVPWITSLLLILGAALLAAALAIWFFARMTSVYARRAGGPRVHMSNS
jgi:hypothetical protein